MRASPNLSAALFSTALAAFVLLLAAASPLDAQRVDWDWRSYPGDANLPAGNYVTPVRNQGSAGTCWAFAATAVLEAKWAITNHVTNPTLDLSEQNLVCSGTNGSTNGGWTDSSLAYIYNTGITTEAKLPYTAQNTSPYWPLTEPYTVYRATSIQFNLSKSSVDAVKTALQDYGPLAVYIQANGDFYWPSSPPVYAAAMGEDQSAPGLGALPAEGDPVGDSINHAVLLTGWTDDPSVPGGGYYHIKNSWGGGWGQGGYGYVLYSTIVPENYSHQLFAITGSVYTEAHPPGWITDADGNWSLAANWNGAVPNAAAATAQFGSIITASRTVTLDTDVTVGTISLDSGSTARSYTLAGPGTLTMQMTSGSAMIQTVTGQHTISAPLRLASDLQISCSGADRMLTINGVISETTSGKSLIAQGSGVVALGGANTFSGPTRIASGTLRLTNPLALAWSTLNMDVGDSGTLDLNGLGVTLGGLTGSRNLALPSGQTISVGQNGANTVYTGVLSGSGTAFRKVGGGILTLSSANTFNGTTRVVGGRLQLNHALALQNSTVDLNAADSGFLDLNGYSAVLGGLSGTRSLAIPPSTTLSVGGNGANTSYSGILIGNGAGLTKIGGGTLTLGGASLFSGTTRIAAGTLQLTNALALQDSTVDLNADDAGILDLNASSATFGSLIGTRNLAIPTGATLTTGGDGTSGSYQGVLSGSGAGVTKAGAGTWTLVAANTFSGATRIAAGTLRLANALALQNSTVDLNAADSGVLDLNGYSATLGGLAGSRNLAIPAGGTLAIGGNGDSTTYSGILAGSGSGLTKAGSGTLVLSGENAYTGPTLVGAGRLVLTQSSASSSFTVASGAALRLDGGTTDLGARPFRALSGGTIEYLGATVNSGWLRGPGTHQVLPGSTSAFRNISTYNSTIFEQDGPADFTNFSNGGPLTNGALLSWSGGGNTASGRLTVNSTMNVQTWTNSGVVTVNSGGVLSNRVSHLVSGWGSRITINPGGTLNVDAASQGATLDLQGALLVNNGTLSGTTRVYSGGLAKGSGVYGLVELYDGGRFSPGNSPGTVTTASASWRPGGHYQFEINDAGGTAGNAWDLWNIAGLLSMDSPAEGESPFMIDVISLSGSAAGQAADFDARRAYQWLIAQARDGIEGFDPAGLTLDVSQFSGDLAGGRFYVVQEDNGVYLNFAPVPEPGTLALLALVGAVALTRRRSRRFLGWLAVLLTFWTDSPGQAAILTYELRATSGTGGAIVVDAKTVHLLSDSDATLTLDVFAVLPNANGVTHTDDGIQSGYLSFQTSTVASPSLPNLKGYMNGGAGSVPTATIGSAFKSGFWTTGTARDMDGDGDFDIGSTSGDDAAAWFYAFAAGTDPIGGTYVMGTDTGAGPTEIKIGTITVKFNAVDATTGSATNLHVIPRVKSIGLHYWIEDGALHSNENGAGYGVQSGTDVYVEANDWAITWNGNGANDSWTTAANWGSRAPVAGDPLVFGAAAHVSNLNDFPADTRFAMISFASGAAVYNLSGNRILLSGDVTNRSASSQTISLDLSLGAGAGTFNASSANLVINGSISGTAGLRKTGSNMLVLNGTNTYSGATTVSAGTLRLGSSAALPAGTAMTIAAGATLDLKGYNCTLRSIGGGGTVSLGSATLTIENAAATTLAVSIGGSGGLAKSGAGDATLTGAVSYSGATTVNAGRLILPQAIPSTSFVVNSGGTLRWDGVSLDLAGRTIRAQSGGTVEYQNATVAGGILRGPGIHVALSGGTSNFNGVTTNVGAVFQQNGTVNLMAFTNGGQIVSNAPLLWDGGVNALGSTLLVQNTATVQDWTNLGSVTIAGGGVLNNALSNLVSGGTMTVNTGGTLNADSASEGLALELQGGRLVNHGTVNGATAVFFGSVAGGTGVFGPVTVADGGRVSPGSSLAATSVATLDLAAGSGLDFEFRTSPSPANGQVVVRNSGGLVIRGGDLNLYQEGTTLAWSQRGTYGLISHSGSIGGSGLSALKVANPQADRRYTFLDAGGMLSLVISSLQKTWNGGGTNSLWSTAQNWEGIAPLADEPIVFDGSARLVNTNDFAAGTRFGGMTFNGTAGGFTLSGNAIQLGGDLVSNSAAAQRINLSMNLVGGSRTVRANAGDVIIAQPIGQNAGNLGLLKDGPGKLSLAAANTYTGGTTVLAGTLAVDHEDALAAQGNLAISAAARVQLAAGLGKAVQIRGLTIAGGASPTGVLDLADGQLILDGTATSAATVEAWVAAGSHLGAWDSAVGITSSLAAADPLTYAVGWARNSGTDACDHWFGRAVDANAIFVRTTYISDADLNGTVNTDDFDLWKFGYATDLSGWSNGDFDYNGLVDTDDFDLWKYTYSQLPPPLAGPWDDAAAAVPEPGVLAWLGFGALGLLAGLCRKGCFPVKPSP